MYHLINLDTGQDFPKPYKQALLDAIPATIPSGPQSCRWLCALEGSPIEAAYFKWKVAGVWKLYTAECATCIRIYQPNIAAIQAWVNARLPEEDEMGLKEDMAIWENRADIFTITPGDSDTSSTINISQGSSIDYVLTGFHVSRAAGTISRVELSCNNSPFTALASYPLDAPAAAYGEKDLQRVVHSHFGGVQLGMAMIITHSATANAPITVDVNYLFRVV